jgi:hypothetical protein
MFNGMIILLVKLTAFIFSVKGLKRYADKICTYQKLSHFELCLHGVGAVPYMQFLLHLSREPELRRQNYTFGYVIRHTFFAFIKKCTKHSDAE